MVIRLKPTIELNKRSKVNYYARWNLGKNGTDKSCICVEQHPSNYRYQVVLWENDMIVFTSYHEQRAEAVWKAKWVARKKLKGGEENGN